MALDSLYAITALRLGMIDVDRRGPGPRPIRTETIVVSVADRDAKTSPFFVAIAVHRRAVGGRLGRFQYARVVDGVAAAREEGVVREARDAARRVRCAVEAPPGILDQRADVLAFDDLGTDPDDVDPRFFMPFFWLRKTL